MALAELGRWAEAEAAIDEGISLIPTFGLLHDFKARCCLALGRPTEGRRHVETARRVGFDKELSERTLRRMSARSPTLEADIAAVRALYTEAELGA